jgi:hypothetical protein
MGPVHKDRGAVRLGPCRDKSAGPDDPRKKKQGKKDTQDDKTVDPRQIYSGPDAKYRFKAYLFKGFRFRRGGALFFSVFIPHIGIIGKAPCLVNERNSC